MVLIVVLIVFGPGKLPDVGKALGRGIHDFKKATNQEPEEAEAPVPVPQPALEAPPVVLVQNGQIVPAGLAAGNVSEASIRATLAERGYASLDQVAMVVRQSNGDIQVYSVGAAAPVTIPAPVASR
jgi:sec-independent protein translocase protein TatA